MSDVNDIQIPTELVEQIAKGNCVLFVGEGISTAEGGLPSGYQLAQELAERCGYKERDISLPKVAQYYKMRLGRQSLLEYVCNRIDSPEYAPLAIHKLISRLPFEVIITTNYDILLDQALRNARKRVTKIVDDIEVAFTDQTKVTLLKIHGDVEQKESIVITEDDHRYLFNRRPIILEFLRFSTAAKTLLFVGYGLGDEDFKRVALEVTQSLRGYKRRAYAIQRTPSDYDKEYWKTKDIEIIDADATKFLENLEEVLKATSPLVVEAASEERVDVLHKHPYKFLDYYETTDADIFFGRERESQQLAQKILSHQLVILFGRSGEGKTSLIKAGIMPILTRQGACCLYVRCDEAPTKLLKESLAEELRAAQVTSMDIAEQPLSSLLGEFEKVTGKNVVIIVDQFEEIFIKFSDVIRREFAREVTSCLDPRTNVRFVLSLRKDFFVELHEFSLELPRIFDNRYHLKGLMKDAAIEAITQPVKDFGISYTDELVQALLEDLYKEGGVEPPQLQIVCDRLYNRLDEDEKTITLNHYRQLGGARRILAEYVDFVLEGFPQDERVFARTILKTMVTSLETRTLLSFEEVWRDVGAERGLVKQILQRLVDYRLVRRTEKENRYLWELAHEYLIVKIRDWIDSKEIEMKRARELLRREFNNWLVHGLHIEENRLQIIYEQREKLKPTHQEMKLLLRSSSDCEFTEAIQYWLQMAIKDLRMNISELKRVCVSLQHSSSNDVRRWLVKLLDDSGDSGAIDLLIGALRDPKKGIRMAAIEALSRNPSEQAIVPLLRLAIKDRNTDVQKNVTNTLLNIVSETRHGIKPMMSVLAKGDVRLRRKAVEVLASLQTQDSVRALIKALGDEDSVVYLTAASALESMRSEKTVVATLIESLRDRDRRTRAKVAGLLGTLKVHEASEELAKLLSDQDREVRDSAVWALQQLETKGSST